LVPLGTAGRYLAPLDLIFHSLRAETWSQTYASRIESVGRERFYPAPRLSIESLAAGAQIEVLDTVNKWYDATVMELDTVRGAIRVHYNCWSSKWDEWLPLSSPRLALIGTHASAYRTPQPVHSIARAFYLGIPELPTTTGQQEVVVDEQQRRQQRAAVVSKGLLTAMLAALFCDIPQLASILSRKAWWGLEGVQDNSGTDFQTDFVDDLAADAPFSMTESSLFHEQRLREHLPSRQTYRLIAVDRTGDRPTFMMYVFLDVVSGQGVAYARYGNERFRY
jgi:hypothetical protein